MKPGTKLKAKCPKCQSGCSECVDGYIDVFFGADDMVMYAIICNNCDTMVGGGFDPADQIKDRMKISRHAMCPNCSGKDLRKEIMYEPEENEGRGLVEGPTSD